MRPLHLPTPAFLFILAFLVSLAACGDRAPDGDRATDGGQGPVALEVTEAPVTVDDDDLVHVGDVVTDADGRTWVLTPYPPLIRIYDPDGTRRAAFGEPGGGPEEFGAAWAFVQDPDGVGVMDTRRGSVRVYDPDGTLVGQRRVEGGPTLPLEARGVYFGDLGWTWRVEGGLLQDRYPPPPAGAPMQMQQAWDFWAADLVFIPDDGGEPRTLVTFSDFSGFSRDDPPAPRVLSAGPLWDLCGDDEFVFHTGAASEVVRIGLDGSVRSRAHVELPLAPLDREIVSEWLVGVISQLPPMPGDTPEAMRERARLVVERSEPYFEATVPPTRLRCDPEGRVWIQLFDLDDDSRGYARDWVVVGREGEILAEVTFPRGFFPVRIGSDRVTGVVRDEFDVETVGWVPTPAVP